MQLNSKRTLHSSARALCLIAFSVLIALIILPSCVSIAQDQDQHITITAPMGSTTATGTDPTGHPVITITWGAPIPPAPTAPSMVSITATATQVVMVVSSSVPCSAQVSESADFATVVHDIDESLFPGASLDTRAGNTVDGTTHTLVVGHRWSAMSGGVSYSLALRAHTAHYYRMTCGLVVLTGQFQTANIPLGNNYPELPPYLDKTTNHYGWPDVLDKPVIDPMTGVSIRKATGPSLWGQSYSDAVTFPALSDTPQFVAAPHVDGSWLPGDSIDNVQIVLTSGAMRACLAGTDHLCLSAWQTVGPTFPDANTFPEGGYWAGWGFTPRHMQFAGFLVKGTGTPVGLVNTAISKSYLMPISGSIDIWSQNAVTVNVDRSGNAITPVQGYLGVIPSTGSNKPALELLIPSTGEVRYLDPLFPYLRADLGQDTVCGNGCGVLSVPWNTADPVDPLTVYGEFQYLSGPRSFLAISYDPTKAGCDFREYAHPRYPSVSASYIPGQDLAQFWYQGGGYADSCIKYTNNMLPSQGLDVLSQFKQVPEWKTSDTLPSIYEPNHIAYSVTSMAFGKALTNTLVVGREEPVAYMISDLKTGKVEYSGDSYSGKKWPAIQWAGLHTGSIADGQQYLSFVGQYLGVFADNYHGDATRFGYGPFTTTPTEIWKNGAWSTDTSIPSDDSIAVSCPTNLMEPLATRLAGTNCIKVRVPQPCSATPYTGEAASFPCPSNPAYSSLAPLRIGATFNRLDLLQAGLPSEVLVVAGSETDADGQTDYILARNPSYASSCGSARRAWTANAAWSMVADCGASWLFDTHNLAVGPMPIVFAGGHAVLGVGDGTPGNYTSIGSSVQSVPYHAQYQKTLANPDYTTGNNALTISSDAYFAGVLPSSQIQSYPSNVQFQAPATERNWFADFHSLNISYGSGPENLTDIASPYGLPAPVAGTSSIYVFQSAATDIKKTPLLMTAGVTLLKDVSGPGSLVSESTPDTGCFVYRAGECYPGSTPGQVYEVITGTDASHGCTSNSFTSRYPCVMPLAANAGRIVQVRDDVSDASAINWRPISMGLMPANSQYQFSTAVPDPTGQVLLFAADWAGGTRTDLFTASLPPFPATSTPATDYRQIPITVTAPTASVAFGYGENGDPAKLYCTSRQEACRTDAKMVFAYEHEATWQSCADGCTINVPAIAGRVLYYRIGVTDANGNVAQGKLQTQVVQ